ncbi:4-hydroxy-tetrahydrodipicolinate synthase [Agriterribacter sp.]|uniref:4-hydroxy-tetrahydrodipicolinate synthase n=1 Tax=Agriterribacter sp. TaxID=2821509 RepID=UPI002BB2C61C|nr:4-hydroxy-tetrahydrodipicolinate synthase [Agriterribacter sp.]HRO45014.1 4-hydroxy-tetrahydrodipicolinate synthase [Agriterribacter sp.]HRQ15545.1 4-hydroxy-tetrahydrodipicolinate synthase [Agriterribacter sp.]
MSLRTQLRGTGVALITPFQNDFSIDYQALDVMIDHMINNGVEYIVSMGTTGEAPTISKEEKKKIVAHTLAKVAGRVPVVVGIGGNNTAETVQELKTFPLDEAVAVLSVSPYYSKPSQEGLFQHYKAVAAASPKPVILYNVPGRTGRNLSAETTIRLAKEVPHIAGIKDAAGDMLQSMQLLKNRPDDFLVCSGDDTLALPQLACGMDGLISVIANSMPRKFSDMVRLALAGKLREAKLLNDAMLETYELLFSENNPAGVKSFLFHLGLIRNVLRLPVTPLSEALHQKAKHLLEADPTLR